MNNLYFAAKALIIHNNKFLALKRSDENKNYWEIPGGRMKFGRRLEETLHREVKEETGLEIIPEKILNSWDLIEESRQISGVIYLCKIKSGVIKLSGEHCEYGWFTIEDLNKLYPEFSNRLTTVKLT